MLLNKQMIRKGYLFHAGWLTVSCLALIIVMVVPDLEKTHRKFVYPYILSNNIFPVLMDLITVSVLQNTAGGFYLTIVTMVNSMSSVLNLSVLSSFVTQYYACTHDGPNHEDNSHETTITSSSDMMNFMCELPKNNKFCIGFIVIMAFLCVGNAIQYIVVHLNGKYNKDMQISEKTDKNQRPKKKNVNTDTDAMKTLHFKALLNTMLDLSLIGCSLLAILTASIVNYSNYSLVFIGQVVGYMAAIAAAFSTTNFKRLWFVVVVSGLAACATFCFFAISVVYFMRLCKDPNDTKEFFDDTKCVIGYRAAICYIILHGLFFTISASRCIINFFHAMYQSNHQANIYRRQDDSDDSDPYA